ncbi:MULTISPECIES: hypothetical protein [unclassified Mesorhizobium]|uniref:hypothetical protein n=1 Tax=unclassified Mesorhizobium TaxID=325217 RepID=UPI0012EC87FD|nr:hypothetical protein [Mesorhizobium sp. LSJC280B00]
MKFAYKTYAALLGAIVLAGCMPSEGEWNTARTLVQGSPAMYKKVLTECIRHSEQSPLSSKQEAGKIMNVSAAAAPRVWCGRTVRAFANGRLTYAEMKRAHLGTGDRSVFIKIVQGR